MYLSFHRSIYADCLFDIVKDEVLKDAFISVFGLAMQKYAKNINVKSDDDLLKEYCDFREVTVFASKENLSHCLEALNVSLKGDQLMTWVEKDYDNGVFVDIIFWDIKFEGVEEFTDFVSRKVIKFGNNERFFTMLKNKLTEALL